jgi:hypothetical protein
VKQLEHLTVGDALLILGALGAVGVAVRKAWPRARDFVLFLTDLMGTPARNGQDAKPGLMEVVADLVEAHGAHAKQMTEVKEQLTEVRAAQQEHDDRLTRVEDGVTEAASAAVTANGKADHMLTDLIEVKEQLGDVVSAQHALAAEQTQIRSAVEGLRPGTDATDNEQGSTS